MRVKGISANVQREIQCSTKVRFTTFTRAQQSAHRQAQRHHEKFAAYACELCGGFHVGGTLGNGSHISQPDARQRYAVYAANGADLDTLVGWSNSADGGVVAKLISEQPGWRVTRIVDRKRRAA